MKRVIQCSARCHNSQGFLAVSSRVKSPPTALQEIAHIKVKLVLSPHVLQFYYTVIVFCCVKQVLISYKCNKNKISWENANYLNQAIGTLLSQSYSQCLYVLINCQANFITVTFRSLHICFTVNSWGLLSLLNPDGNLNLISCCSY